MKELKHLI